MKLLRITSDAIDGTFNGFLNQEIEIGKGGQIALQSATFEVTDRALKIDGSNDTINFQTANASGIQTIVLNHTDGTGTNVEQYDSTNLQVFFNDMTNKINSQFALTRNNQIGKQFRIKTHTDGKVQASFESSAFNSRAGELQANISTGTVNGANNAPTLVYQQGGGGSQGDRFGNISTTDNTAGAAQYSSFTHYNFPITKGCGIMRIQLAELQRIDATHRGGFTIALSRRNPHTATAAFTDNDIVAGVRCLQVEEPVANTVYSSIINGVPTPNALRADQGVLNANDLRNDHIELAVTTNNVGGTADGRVIQMNVYRRQGDGAGAATYDLNTLATTPYATDAVEGDNLYAYVFLHGSQPVPAALRPFTCRFGTPRFTADPFLENAVNPVSLETDYSPSSLGVKPDPPRNRNTIHFINFGDDSVYEWLGYNVAQPPSQTDANVAFVANNLFGSKMIAEAFLVQLLNLPVEAYDTFKEGRENLLAVIPQSDADLNVIYEPNGLYFIDLNNNFPIKLSNIRLRILRQDYSEVQTRGLNSVVLYIKNNE